MECEDSRLARVRAVPLGPVTCDTDRYFERLELWLDPDLGRSSENRGPVKGEEARPAGLYIRSDKMEEVSERASLLELVGRFRFSSNSNSILGSIDSRGRFPQPF